MRLQNPPETLPWSATGISRNKAFIKDKLNYVFINQIKFGSNLKQYSLSYLSKIDPTQPFQNNGGNSF